MTPSAGNAASTGPGDTPPAVMRLYPRLLRIDHDTDFEALTTGLHTTPFQSAFWLRTWFTVWRAEAVEAFWVSLVDDTERVLLAMPLIRRRILGWRVLEGVDMGVSDLNAPLISPALPESACPRAIFACFRAALPKADLLRILRMPATVAGRSNPLGRDPAGMPSGLHHWMAVLPGSREAFHAGLSPGMRETLGKKRRRFERLARSEARVARSGAEALDLMLHLETLQEQRITSKGLKYRLNEVNIKSFYRALACKGVETGRVMICALVQDESPVAVNYSCIHDGRMTYLRVANRMEGWHNLQPGLLVTEYAISQAIDRNIPLFDFSVGDYDYKRRFGAQPQPLQDIVIALSWSGFFYRILLVLRRGLLRIAFLRRMAYWLRARLSARSRQAP